LASLLTSVTLSASWRFLTVTVSTWAPSCSIWTFWATIVVFCSSIVACCASMLVRSSAICFWKSSICFRSRASLRSREPMRALVRSSFSGARGRSALARRGRAHTQALGLGELAVDVAHELARREDFAQQAVLLGGERSRLTLCLLQILPAGATSRHDEKACQHQLTHSMILR
jgi:hypothetical protein